MSNKHIWYKTWEKYGHDKDEKFFEYVVREDISPEDLDELIRDEIYDQKTRCEGLEVWNVEFEVLPDGTYPPRSIIEARIRAHERSAKFHLDEADRFDEILKKVG